MQYKTTAAQICTAAADHIEAHGLLFDAWDSEDGTKDLPPCCCLVGTMRYVAGLPPTPHDGMAATDGTPLFEAIKAVRDQTMAERHVLADKIHGPAALAMPDITDWSNRYADVEVVCRKRRDGRREFRRLDHSEGDRRHASAMLRQAALRCEAIERAGPRPVTTRNTNCLEELRCPRCGSLGPFGIGTCSSAIVHDDGINETFEHEWDKDSPISCQECDESGQVWDFKTGEATHDESRIPAGADTI